MSTMPRTADSTVLSRLSKNLGRLLEEKGLNANQLSVKSGVSSGIICHLLKQEREPSVSTLEKICRVLEVSLDDLLRESPRRAKASV
jgi:DNA-binding Xre family transcriptional regulator